MIVNCYPLSLFEMVLGNGPNEMASLKRRKSWKERRQQLKNKKKIEKKNRNSPKEEHGGSNHKK